MSGGGESARQRPALRVALVAADPIRHQGRMAIIHGGGHAVVEDHAAADVILVEGDGIDQYGPPAVTLGRADCGQAGALPADATATMTVFITDARHGDRFTQLRKEIFGDNFPASALITVAGLARPEMLVEVQGIAVLG